MTRLGMPDYDPDRREFARIMLSTALAKLHPDKGDRRAHAKSLFASGTWGDTRSILNTLEAKAAVGGTELDTSVPAAYSSFARGAFEKTVLGRIPGGRSDPFQQSVLRGRIIAGGGGWQKSGRAIKVLKAEFSAARSSDTAPLASSSRASNLSTMRRRTAASPTRWSTC